MAEQFVNVYVDSTTMMMYFDEALAQPISQVLFRKSEDDPALYLDKNLLIRLNPITVTPSMSSPAGAQESWNAEAQTTLPPHQTFTREETLFLIDLRRQHLTSTSPDLPKSLAELNLKIRQARGQKAIFWKEMASKLTSKFNMVFEHDKVARKWATLEDGFKKVLDNQKSTGGGVMKFQFYTEMMELIGENHDVDFPVVASAKGITVRRPDAVFSRETQAQTSTWRSSGPEKTSAAVFTEDDSSSSDTTGRTPGRKRKNQSEKSQLLEFLQEAEAASQRRHEEQLKQMQEQMGSFEKLLQQLINKQ